MRRDFILLVLLFLILSPNLFGQVDRREIRRGNRAFSKGEYKEALIEYKRALEKDSLSLKGGYNLGNTLFRGGSSKEAEELLQNYSELAMEGESRAALHYNLGNYALDMKEYHKAIEYYKESLRENPLDMASKSNLAYAQAMAEDQDQEGGGEGEDEDEDEQGDNEDDGENDDKGDDDEKEGDPDEGEGPEQEQEREQQLDQQGMQQLLRAIENKDKETQEKVEREKAKRMERGRREKNW